MGLLGQAFPTVTVLAVASAVHAVPSQAIVVLLLLAVADMLVAVVLAAFGLILWPATWLLLTVTMVVIPLMHVAVMLIAAMLTAVVLVGIKPFAVALVTISIAMPVAVCCNTMLHEFVFERAVSAVIIKSQVVLSKNAPATSTQSVSVLCNAAVDTTLLKILISIAIFLVTSVVMFTIDRVCSASPAIAIAALKAVKNTAGILRKAICWKAF